MCFVTDLQSKIIILPGILIFGLFQLEFLSQKDIKLKFFKNHVFSFLSISVYSVTSKIAYQKEV